MSITLGTQTLNTHQIWQEIEWFVAWLRAQGVEDVTVIYGWACRSDVNGQELPVALDTLVAHLQTDVAGGVFELGEANVTLAVAQPACSLLLCHEADLHFKADDPALIDQLRDHWTEQGYRLWGGKPSKRASLT